MPAESYLIIARSSPYGSHQARAAADLALTAAAFEEDVTVVFMDEGVWQLARGQDTEASGLKNLGKMIPALKLYEVRRLYVHEASIEKSGLTQGQLMADVETIDDDVLRGLVADADHVMVFS